MSEIVNVSKVPQRSPFRYPGGKTWLIPTIREWLGQSDEGCHTLIEPFAGGGIVSLTAAFEYLADNIIMSELDPEMACAWQTILGDDNDWLARRIEAFEMTIDNLKDELYRPDKQTRDIGFCTILKNRTYHGGILAKGSGILKHGENGKGILSRWYPTTLKERLIAINHIRHKIDFYQLDAFTLLQQHRLNNIAYWFIDPPYTIAGKRLYTFYDIDHDRLFNEVSQLKGRFLLTYDDTPFIRELADKYHFDYRSIPMKTTHHLEKMELLISDNFQWY